jgi:hypothetical protein
MLLPRILAPVRAREGEIVFALLMKWSSYVVDEEAGVVSIFVGFPGLDRNSTEPTPDSHTFRVEHGKIRYIHTLSTCEGHPGCGMNSTLRTLGVQL